MSGCLRGHAFAKTPLGGRKQPTLETSNRNLANLPVFSANSTGLALALSSVQTVQLQCTPIGPQCKVTPCMLGLAMSPLKCACCYWAWWGYAASLRGTSTSIVLIGRFLVLYWCWGRWNNLCWNSMQGSALQKERCGWSGEGQPKVCWKRGPFERVRSPQILKT